MTPASSASPPTSARARRSFVAFVLAPKVIVEPGAKVLVSTRQALAFGAVVAAGALVAARLIGAFRPGLALGIFRLDRFPARRPFVIVGYHWLRAELRLVLRLLVGGLRLSGGARAAFATRLAFALVLAAAATWRAGSVTGLPAPHAPARRRRRAQSCSAGRER